MSDYQDPFLQTLFVEQQQELAHEEFTDNVLNLTRAHRRKVLFGRLAIAALIVILELLLDSPMQHSLGTVTEVLGATLYQIENEWLAFVLTPVNSVAGLLGATLLGLQFVHHRLFR